ncbi:unnamed protein product [Amoebophrya sp. A120]|nr:unnamed protein product [Amoebophrya sp. A120]|eukprot:GSA120T00019431001.1
MATQAASSSAHPGGPQDDNPATSNLTPQDAAFLREHAYLAKLAEKEREIQKYKQIANDVQNRFEDNFEKTSLRFAMVDPAVNMEILRLRQKIRSQDEEIDALKMELKATQFKPTSISGQKLMKKCRALLEENQSLGRQISEGPIQDLLVALGSERQTVKQLKEKLKQSETARLELDNECERLCALVESNGGISELPAMENPMYSEMMSGLGYNNSSAGVAGGGTHSASSNGNENFEKEDGTTKSKKSSTGEKRSGNDKNGENGVDKKKKDRKRRKVSPGASGAVEEKEERSK